jgi:uncharacterized protein
MIDFANDPLDPFQIRILGVLAEKQSLTPDVYPLSIHAITAGANQLSNRDPVMQISDGTVEATLKGLQARQLVRTYYPMGSRVAKYEHLLRDVFALDDPRLALLTILLLRGAQTPGELRQRTARMYPFASVESVERSLTDLAGNAPALAVRLERAPGEKESRWTHLFAGTVAIERGEVAAGFAPLGASTGSFAVELPGNAKVEELSTQVTELRREIDALRAEFDQFRKQFE